MGARTPAVRQVWLLALLAVGTTGLVLLLMSVAARQVRETSEELAQSQEAVHKMALSMELHLSEVQHAQFEWLAGRPPVQDESARRQKESLQNQFETLRTAPHLARLGNRVASLETSLRSLRDFTGECMVWHETYTNFVTGLARLKERSDEIIRGIGAVTTSAEGRMRLPRARKIRELRNLAPGPDSVRLAQEIVSDQEFREMIDEVQGELATLALLIERLLSEGRSDQLPSYQDDLLPGSLARLLHGMDRMAQLDHAFAAGVLPFRSSLPETVLGTPSPLARRPQAMVQGDDSLYSKCWARSELEKQRELLRKASVSHIDSIRASGTDLQIGFSELQRATSLHASETMEKTGHRMVIGGLLCGGLFLVLARRIAATLNRQIATIETSNAALDEAVTEARAAADLVRNSEERTRLIVDTALDAVISMDACGLITAWNHQAELTFGWRFEEVRGRMLAEVIVPERLREGHRQGMGRFLATRVPAILNRRIEVPALRKDGQEVPVELTVTPIDYGGSLTFSAFLRDISARKQSEADVLRAKDEAESATRMLQSSLQTAERLTHEAQAASTAKSEFLATMSHEIRTPMNGILGFGGLLLDTDLTVEQREYVSTIKGSADSLLAIINDILDFSKVEAGRLELENSWFDLGAAVRDVTRLLSAQAQAKGINLEFHLSSLQLPAVFGDPARVRQVLLNLAGNSLKFTEAGSVRIGIEHEPGWESPNILPFLDSRKVDGRLRVVLTDTGIGVPKDKQGQLFQKFVQADSSHSRRYGGTGLGLAICKRMVELMGGEIGFESEEGKGSRFWFTLPCEQVQPAATGARGENSRATVAPSPGSAAERLRGLRVLVAEDNKTNQVLITTLLRKAGCVVDLAQDGREAVTFACERDYAVVLMDCHMPELDGFEATIEIRGWEAALRGVKPESSTARIPIVALTASLMDDDRRRCLACGMDDVLGKPVYPHDLYSVLCKWVERPSGASKFP